MRRLVASPWALFFGLPPLVCGSDRSWLVHTTTYTAGTLIAAGPQRRG